jgi:hypothetical protein
MLSKLKERKQIANEVLDCLSNLLYCGSPEDISDDIQTLLSDNKTAKEFKINILKWLEIWLKKQSFFTGSNGKNLMRNFVKSFGKL